MFSRLYNVLVLGLMTFVLPANGNANDTSMAETQTVRSPKPVAAAVMGGMQAVEPAKPQVPDADQKNKPPKLIEDKSLLPLSPANDEIPLDGQSLPPPPPGFREVSMDEANAIKPPLNILDLHGYLRFRGDISHGADLGLSENEPYPQFPKSASGRTKTLSMANMRFRLEPTINIAEDVRIMSQIDMLDNLILGSTPNGYPTNPYYPVVALSQDQLPPSHGYNASMDSILVKRVWGEVMLPVGLLRFGRMGSHWGLGLWHNDGGPAHLDRGPLVTQIDRNSPVGQCFDCDYGTTVDRIMFVTKISGHYIIPMMDFSGEGPSYPPTNGLAGQSWDADQMDDVNSYGIAVAKRDKPEDVRDALERGEGVLNYGLYFTYRNQTLDAVAYHNKPSGESGSVPISVEDYAARDYKAYIPDIWVRYQQGKLRLEFEFVAILGRIGRSAVEPSINEEGIVVDELAGKEITMDQFAGVLQMDYLLMDDQINLGLEIGYASGDDSPGFGVRPFAEAQFSHENGDNNINNFRFHPDYHVDMILWRQIVGTVTDAYYVKPSFQYNIAEGIGTKLSAIYSAAVNTSSTRGKNSPLGLELDVDFFYFSDDKFHAGFSYGLLVPLSGMNDLGADGQSGGTDFNADKDAEIAHRIMGRLVLYF